jgi:hypothetical protein
LERDLEIIGLPRHLDEREVRRDLNKEFFHLIHLEGEPNYPSNNVLSVFLNDLRPSGGE